MSETPAYHRFDGAAAWSTLSAEEQTVIGAVALELVAHMVLADRVYQDALPKNFARIEEAAHRELTRDLHSLVTGALPDEAFEAEDGAPRIPSLLGGVCRVCACSQNDACPEGCGWTAEDLCTACAEKAAG